MEAGSDETRENSPPTLEQIFQLLTTMNKNIEVLSEETRLSRETVVKVSKSNRILYSRINSLELENKRLSQMLGLTRLALGVEHIEQEKTAVEDSHKPSKKKSFCNIFPIKEQRNTAPCDMSLATASERDTSCNVSQTTETHVTVKSSGVSGINEDLFNSGQKEEHTSCDSLKMEPGAASNIDWPEVVDNFTAMNLKQELLQGIYGYGFEKPSDIQQRAIMPCIKGRDAVILSLFGTGKKTASVISILQLIDTTQHRPTPQALLLAPTRELALDVQTLMITLGEFMNIQCHACIGGTKIGDEKKKFQCGYKMHVIVGTPGRVLDVISRKLLRTEDIKLFVVVDTNMFSGIFKDQVFKVFETLSSEVQTIICSTTLTYEISEIASSFTRNPVFISKEGEELPWEDIEQFYVLIDSEKEKLKTFWDMCSKLNNVQAVVFTNTRKQLEFIVQNVTGATISSISLLHGGMNQEERKASVNLFNTGVSRLLISTGIACSLIMNHFVINYDIPTRPETYIQRIMLGCGFERKHVVINLATKADQKLLRGFEMKYNIHIKEVHENIKIFGASLDSSPSDASLF